MVPVSFHRQQFVPSHNSDVVASFRSHSIGSKSFKHSRVIFIALESCSRSIVSPSSQCPPTPTSSFHRPEVEFVLASSHRPEVIPAFQCRHMSSRPCGVPPSGRPSRVIPGSSFSARPKRSTFRGRVPTVSDRFTTVRSVHSPSRTLFPAFGTVQPTDSRPFADNAISDRFPKPTRRPRSVGLELRRHPGVTPSSRSFPSLRCRSIISQSL